MHQAVKTKNAHERAGAMRMQREISSLSKGSFIEHVCKKGGEGHVIQVCIFY